jgi:hypothetical protein
MYEFLSCRQIPCRIQKYKKSADGKNGLNFVDCHENLTFEQIRIRNMKALFLSLFLTFSLIALSQDGIVIHLDGQTADISGQSHTVAVTSGSAFDVQFHVINETGQNVNWRVSRKKLVTPNNLLFFFPNEFKPLDNTGKSRSSCIIAIRIRQT